MPSTKAHSRWAYSGYVLAAALATDLFYNTMSAGLALDDTCTEHTVTAVPPRHPITMLQVRIQFIPAWCTKLRSAFPNGA